MVLYVYYYQWSFLIKCKGAMGGAERVWVKILTMPLIKITHVVGVVYVVNE